MGNPILILAGQTASTQKLSRWCLSLWIWLGINLLYNLFLFFGNHPKLFWNFVRGTIFTQKISIKIGSLFLLFYFYCVCVMIWELIIIGSFVVIKLRRKFVWIEEVIFVRIGCFSKWLLVFLPHNFWVLVGLIGSSEIGLLVPLNRCWLNKISLL